MTSERYALLIGINDYQKEPLPFCVKDVNDLSDVLISNCKFSKSRIFKIISPKNNQINNITKQLEKVLDDINEEFKKGQDTFLFYFSGHGELVSNRSETHLLFHDEKYQVTKIIEFMDKINPKMSYLILDACYSGGNLLSKDKGNPSKKIRNKILHSGKARIGIYSTIRNKQAFQSKDLENSIFTHYFVEAIKNHKNYSPDNTLSIDVIYDRAAKATFLHESPKVVIGKGISFHEQVAVKEGRIEGPNEFAFLVDSNYYTKGSSSNVENSGNVDYKSLFQIFDLSFQIFLIPNKVQKIVERQYKYVIDQEAIEDLTIHLERIKELLNSFHTSPKKFIKSLKNIYTLCITSANTKYPDKEMERNIKFTLKKFLLDYETEMTNKLEKLEFNSYQLGEIITKDSSLFDEEELNKLLLILFNKNNFVLDLSSFSPYQKYEIIKKEYRAYF